MHALDAHTGAAVHSYDSDGLIKAKALVDPKSGRIFLASYSRKLVILVLSNVDGFECLASHDIGASIYAAPIAVSSFVICCATNGSVTAIHSTSMKLAWRNAVSSSPFFSTPLSVESIVMMADVQGCVYGVKCQTGELVCARRRNLLTFWTFGSRSFGRVKFPTVRQYSQAEFHFTPPLARGEYSERITVL